MHDEGLFSLWLLLSGEHCSCVRYKVCSGIGGDLSEPSPHENYDNTPSLKTLTLVLLAIMLLLGLLVWGMAKYFQFCEVKSQA